MSYIRHQYRPQPAYTDFRHTVSVSPLCFIFTGSVVSLDPPPPLLVVCVVGPAVVAHPQLAPPAAVRDGFVCDALASRSTQRRQRRRGGAEALRPLPSISYSAAAQQLRAGVVAKAAVEDDSGLSHQWFASRVCCFRGLSDAAGAPTFYCRALRALTGGEILRPHDPPVRWDPFVMSQR